MQDRNFVGFVAVAYIAVALIPTLFGYGAAGDRLYTGFEVNTDDMCVYSAWMEQARRGHFLFDNRFTTDEQPRLTIHLFFYVLGTVSRITGLPHPVVFHLARAVFGLLFIFSAWRLISRLAKERFVRRMMLGTLLVSGGVGWLFVGMSGVSGPTDLWQPEGFVFPSLMTNALFAASLWLIVEVWLAVLDAREGWRPVARGFLAMLALGDIHTYDVLSLALIAVAFAAAAAGAGVLTGRWAPRTVVIFLGAAPPVVWLWHVRNVDEVFASRAATLTFSPEFRQFAVGYLPLLLLAAVWVWLELRGRVTGAAWRLLVWLVPAILIALSATRGWLNRLPEGAPEGAVFLGAGLMAAFFSVFALLVVGGYALARHLHAPAHYRPAQALVIAWGAIALWLPFFPALFQRKLTMGAHVPLALLAGLGLAAALGAVWRPRHEPRLAALVVLLLLSVSNVLWLQRSLLYIQTNQASTGIHPVYLTKDEGRALRWLRANADEDAVVLDLTWLACFVPAFAGQRTYASHWSETPDFGRKFAFVNRDLYDIEGSSRLSLPERYEAVRALGIDYVVWHKPPAGERQPMTDWSEIGETAFDAPTLAIVRVR